MAGFCKAPSACRDEAFISVRIYEQHRLVLPQPVNEEADRALMRQLLFNRQDVELVSLMQAACEALPSTFSGADAANTPCICSTNARATIPW